MRNGGATKFFAYGAVSGCLLGLTCKLGKLVGKLIDHIVDEGFAEASLLEAALLR